ncbi:DUF4236 domain-containing protein [Gammaproteobacteria bacterium]
MGFRFEKRIRLVKGLTLNLSKTGVSLTVGIPGASVNLGKDGLTGNAGLPGTGLSYREKLSGRPWWRILLLLTVIAVMGFFLWR